MVPETKKNQEALDWVDDNWDELDNLADSFGVSIIAREPGPGYDFKHDGESLALKAGVSASTLRLAFVEAVKGKRPDAVLALLETRDDDLPPGTIL